jgi:branched-chain amino acid transport system permease protein
VRRLLKDFRLSVLPVPGRLIAIVFFVALFVGPLIVEKRVVTSGLTYASIFAIFAVSWDVLSGYTGLVNFGHALFFGVGAYGTALLNQYLGWQPWATIPVAALIAALVGLLTCLPALRLRGPYLTLLTLSFPIMLLGIVFSFKDITGGEHGIWGVPGLADSRTAVYYICLIAMTASVLIMWKLTDAGSRYIRTGLIFHAIREDEITARATGINTIRYKMVAFTIGGFFAGIAGALYAHVLGVAGASALSMTLSFQAIIWVVFGGIVSIYGAVVGVYVLYPLLNIILLPIIEYGMLILAVLVVLILLFMPEGIAVWVRDKIERECPRCKLTNGFWRKECRACSASLH